MYWFPLYPVTIVTEGGINRFIRNPRRKIFLIKETEVLQNQRLTPSDVFTRTKTTQSVVARGAKVATPARFTRCYGAVMGAPLLLIQGALTWLATGITEGAHLDVSPLEPSEEGVPSVVLFARLAERMSGGLGVATLTEVHEES
jgi:hypothetical protein